MPDLTEAEVVLRLRAAGCVFAEDEAAILVAAATSGGELADMVERRSEGYPLEHVVGWAEFCGLRIAVAAGVFVPRVRSEFLVQQAAELAFTGAVVVDLCCGSGALGLAVAAMVGEVDLVAADVDRDAVACARANLGEAGRVFEGDLYDALPPELEGRVDVLVVNAPYVPTDEIAFMPAEARLHEAVVALDGGRDGLDLHRRVAAGVRSWLAPDGHVLIETSERQAPVTLAIFQAAGLDAVAVSNNQDATVVIARLSHAAAPAG